MPFDMLTSSLLIALTIALTALLFLKRKSQSNHFIYLQTNLLEEKQKSQITQTQLLTLTQQNATLQAEKKSLQQQLLIFKEQEKENEKKLLLQFQNLANNILEQKSQKFTEQNKQQLQQILHPLKEKITHFDNQIAQTQREAADRNIALRTQLKQMVTLHHEMSQKAENLTQAIKGNNTTQGHWGEFILENILEKSGLRKGKEYLVQTSFTTQEGKRYRPDVIIQLPEQKNIIIDAKVSLVDYEKFFHTQDPKQKEKHLKKHLISLKNHIKSLQQKNYALQYNLKSLDFVLMFLPIEPAFMLAMQYDSTLLDYAYQQNIILVGPSTLMATLRTIANIWKNKYQNDHALQIAQQSGALYDKFVSFLEDYQKIGHSLLSTQKVYQNSMRKLTEGNGNLINKAEKLKQLGARTNKSLPTLVPQLE